MKKITHVNFKGNKIVKIGNKYFINTSNCNNYIVLDSIKYYNIKRKELRLLGMKFPKKEVIPMTDDEIKELRTLLREYIKVNEKSIGNKMVEMGYKLKGFNC